jgi:hypothetical protein
LKFSDKKEINNFEEKLEETAFAATEVNNTLYAA